MIALTSTVLEWHQQQTAPPLASLRRTGPGQRRRRLAQRGLTAVTCHTERVRERTQSRPRS